MGILFYFIFGVLNIFLIHLLSTMYSRITGYELFPGDKMEMFMVSAGYFFCGIFGTALLILVGIIILMKRKKD